MATSSQAGAGRAGPRSRRAPVDLEALGNTAGVLTAIKVQARAPERRSLFLDGQFLLGLHQEVAAAARLKVGMHLTGPALVALASQDEERRARDAAGLLLSGSARTRREVERRLLRSYRSETVRRVLEGLESAGLLDDAEFARRYVAARSDQGEARLLRDLIRRGVPRPVAGAAVQEGRGAGSAVAAAREVAEQRLGRISGLDRQTAHRRLAGFLARRGFDFETIGAALAPLLQRLPAPPRPARSPFRRARPEEEE